MADAPRFKSYWQKVEGTSVLVMPREEWNMVAGSLGTAMEIDVRSTPLSRVTQTSSVVTTIIHDPSSANTCLSIYRYDEKDAPHVINKDEYNVWTDVTGHQNFHQTISLASTANDANLQQYCEENVFFVKKERGEDHWLTEVPSSVYAIMEST